MCEYRAQCPLPVQRIITQDARQDRQRGAENQQDDTVEDDVSHRRVVTTWHHARAAAQAVEAND